MWYIIYLRALSYYNYNKYVHFSVLFWILSSLKYLLSLYWYWIRVHNSVSVKSFKFSWDTSKLTSGGGSVYRSINGVYGSWLSLNGCVLFLAASSDYGFQMCKCCLFLNLGMECSWWHWDKQVFQWLAGYLLSSILCIILIKQSSLFTYYPLIRLSLFFI